MDSLNLVDRLVEAGVRNAESYRRKLSDNSGEPTVFRDLVSERVAALMFSMAGFVVEMGESPDLTLTGFGQSLSAEVKHFRYKQQDAMDNVKLREYSDYLIEFGNTVPTEGKTAWEQVAAVAQRKVRQYRAGTPNLLVLESSSPHCVDDVVVRTARNILDEETEVGTNPHLSRLNGIVFLSSEFNVSTRRNAYFFETSYPRCALLASVRDALKGIRRWSP